MEPKPEKPQDPWRDSGFFVTMWKTKNKTGANGMLKPQVQLRLTEYDGLYDLIVDKDHLLRKIKENIDFGFVNPMLRESCCEKFGRPAKEPEMMFKLEFLKKIYDLSDEALIRDVLGITLTKVPM